MSEFFARRVVSIQSQIRAVRMALADHRDPQAARNRIRNLTPAQHDLEQQDLTAALERLLGIESEERMKSHSPPRAG